MHSVFVDGPLGDPQPPQVGFLPLEDDGERWACIVICERSGTTLLHLIDPCGVDALDEALQAARNYLAGQTPSVIPPRTLSASPATSREGSS